MKGFNERVANMTLRLADKTAASMHRALDVAIIQELGNRLADDAALSGEAQSLAGFIANWRRQALTATSVLIVGGFTCLGLTAIIQNPIPRFITANGAVVCWFGARRQRQIALEALPIVGIMARLQAARTAQELSLFWDAKTVKQQATTVENVPKTLPEPLALFDWNQLRDCDRFPHFLICGGTGSGKTYTTERIVKFLGGDVSVITTKAKGDQWEGLKVIGKGRNFDAIALALAGLLQEMQRRMQDLDANHAPKIVVLDEFPSITANIESATDIVTTLIREAREAKIRLFILSQGRQVKTLKLEGQSDLRENLTDILLGQFATDRAKELVGRKQAQPALLDWCRGQSRPILVADEPALLSQIS